MKYCLLVVSLFICCFIFSNQSSFGQNNPKDTLTRYYLKIAKGKIDEKRFSEANDLFKKIFALKTTVPDELAYHYGYTLLNLKKFTQGKNAIYKYLDLQGDTGAYSQKAYAALEEADCLETGYKDIFMECDVCYGDSTLDITCRLCKGTGVATTSSNFGNSYHTCHRCNGEKIVKCTVCKGHLKEKIICYNCNGRGRKKIRKKC